MKIGESETTLLDRVISDGQSILVLGAGASASSRGPDRQKVCTGPELARLIATAAGFSFAGEALPIVMSAARPILGDRQIRSILEREFSNITPGNDLSNLFRFTWKRLYTWNIDDAVNNINTHRVQRHRHFNALNDQVTESTDYTILQIVKLHGDITHPDHGFIMSEADYTTALSTGGYPWYRQLGNDYLSFTPIFIGTRLEESILATEIERAKRSSSESAGRGFVITPDNLSELQRAALLSKGLFHIQSTLAEFSNWLLFRYPNGIEPKDVLIRTHSFLDPDRINRIDASDIPNAASLYQKDADHIYARALNAPAHQINSEARRFLRGFPPTWDIAASDIPVWLSPTTDLYNELNAAIKRQDRMFVVTGQAGSGKSTAIMQSLLRFGKNNKDYPIFELTSDVKSIKSAFNLLSRIYDYPVIIYVSDLFVFGDQLVEDILSIGRGNITVVATARRSEWNEHLVRPFGSVATQYEFSRFRRADYQPLIDRLLKYVPAPAFNALSAPERVERLSRSKEQLLIALREATSSDNFSDIITNEFERLPDEDTRKFLTIVGLATIARVGIEPGSAKEAYRSISQRRTFEDAEKAADGIVSRIANGRLFARHELYVRHIIDQVIDLDSLLDAIISIANTYTKYPVPIVRNVSKTESVLFRFCWNHRFIFEQCHKRSRIHDGERLYSTFEIPFQRDGHFWLQYGLYLKLCGRYEDAVMMLRRSIEAYPNNIFAIHAYAEMQLTFALNRGIYDTACQNLITSAVTSLERLDAQQLTQIDQYPLVTLSLLHIGVLVRYNRNSDAIRYAKDYFDRIQRMEKRVNSSHVTDTKDRLLRFITLGEWPSFH